MPEKTTTDWFAKHGVTPPSSTPHGVSIDDLSEKLRPLKAKSWRLEGNRLVAETSLGQVVNYIDPGVIMTGVGQDGLPIFRRI